MLTQQVIAQHVPRITRGYNQEKLRNVKPILFRRTRGFLHETTTDIPPASEFTRAYQKIEELAEIQKKWRNVLKLSSNAKCYVIPEL